MNEQHIIDIWHLFRDHVDKKHLDELAEKYINLLVDLEVEDSVIEDLLSLDPTLDAAIQYYLDIDEEEDDDDDIETDED